MGQLQNGAGVRHRADVAGAGGIFAINQLEPAIVRHLLNSMRIGAFQKEFNYPFVGYSQKENRDWTGSHTMYRFHIEDPIYFQKSLRATIEHGHANSREDEYTSVAFWYQAGPHQRLLPLPPVEERQPTSFWKIQKLDRNLPN